MKKIKKSRHRRNLEFKIKMSIHSRPGDTSVTRREHTRLSRVTLALSGCQLSTRLLSGAGSEFIFSPSAYSDAFRHITCERWTRVPVTH